MNNHKHLLRNHNKQALYNYILGAYENPDEVLDDIHAESVYANSDTNNKITENDQNNKQKKVVFLYSLL
jgi:hypothetical protein